MGFIEQWTSGTIKHYLIFYLVSNSQQKLRKQVLLLSHYGDEKSEVQTGQKPSQGPAAQ